VLLVRLDAGGDDVEPEVLAYVEDGAHERGGTGDGEGTLDKKRVD
jgi:hypothetical protein